MLLYSMEEYRKQFVLNMLAYAVQRNLPPDQLCRMSGLDFKLLKERSSPAIAPKQLNDLWRNAVHLSHDAAFGLHFGESLQLSALGAVGQIIQSSKTVGEALTLASQSIHLITDLFSMKVTRANKIISIRFIPHEEASAAYPDAFWQMMELFMVFTIHELDGLIFEKTAPAKVRFPLNDAVDTKEYERVLRCKPKHVQDEWGMEFKDVFWDEAIITANHELQRLLLEMTHSGSVASPQEPPLSERIVNYLTANAYLGIASLEEIAANFNTSARTLQRKLQEEGVSFQQLADSVRKTIALQYLSAGNHPLKEVSYILGYNELSAFTRAFKRWTGTTPFDYQKNKR